MAKLKSRSKAKRPKKSTTKKKSSAAVKTPGNATPVKELERLAGLSDNCRDRSKTASGQIGQAIKVAVDEKHLNARAFRAVLAERRMGKDDPIKLRDFLSACGYYRTALSIDDLTAGDMMAPAKPKKTPASSKSSGTKTIGEAAGNVVSLAGAMKDAIDKDKASDMDAA